MVKIIVDKKKKLCKIEANGTAIEFIGELTVGICTLLEELDSPIKSCLVDSMCKTIKSSVADTSNEDNNNPIHSSAEETNARTEDLQELLRLILKQKEK